MRNFKNFLLMGLLPLVGFALLAGCDETPDKVDDKPVVPPPVEKDATIRLAKTMVTAAVSGGSYLIEYDIENAHQGEKLSAVAAEEWVYDFDTSISGAIGFKVAPNDGDVERETLVTVSYRFAEDVTFVVKQGAMTSATFSVEKVGSGSEYFSFTVNIFPSNKQLPYIVMSASPSYIAEWELESDQALYEDDYSYFEYIGKFYGMSTVEVMQNRAKLGDERNLTVGQAIPGETYIIYCYYFDYDTGALISDIARFEITVDHPEVQDLDPNYFTFEYEIVGPRVHTDVKSSADVDYYYDVMTEAELDYAESAGYTKEEYIKKWWANIVGNMHHSDGYSTYDIVAQNTCQGTDSTTGRPRSQWSYDLLANTNYYLFAFNMSEDALCVTTPQFVKFTTGAVEPSDNQISISVDGITAYRASVNIEATYDKSEDNYRHAYVTHIATADEWKTFGANDTARMNYIKNNFSLEYMWGSQSISYSNIEPDTEYVAYAFGLYGGVVTTQLWTATFRTKSDAPGEVDITLKDLGYYDPADLAMEPGFEFFGSDSYSGVAITPLSIEFSKKNHGDYFLEIYDWTGRNDEYTDEQYMSGLIWQIETYGSYSTTDTYTMLKWGGRYVIVGIVVDVNGQYSKLFKREFVPSYDGVRPVEDFIGWWNTWNGGGSLQSLVVSEAPVAEKNSNVIEVDASVSKRLVKSNRVKASEMTFENKGVEPEVTTLNATR